jgi:hypothetical protein
MSNKMSLRQILRRLPGYLAAGLMILLTGVWTFWGVAEMYHEGWWGAWYNRLPYLIPGTVCLALTLIALTWPRLGGALIVVIGGAFTVFFMDFRIVDGRLTFRREVGGFLVSGSLLVLGVLFLVDGFLKRRRRFQESQERQGAQSAGQSAQAWWRRHLGYVLAVGLPLLIVVGVSAYSLPTVLTRVDDGERGARLIEGNGVTLVWAPEGPGWNWRQPWGGYPSWDRVALYGVEPVGLGDKAGYGRQNGAYVHATAEDMAAANLCRYLSADGLTLMDEPQDVWRMPTTDEVVRSLVRDGENAGCAWNGEYAERVTCDVAPDKETPLWAPDLAPVYYWTADAYDDWRGYFVSYNGFVNATSKSGGNPRHSYRCVRELTDEF